MMRQFGAILWKDMVIFRRKFAGITLSALVSPLLYLVVFGFGLGSAVNFGGEPYVMFIIPGLAAMSSMMQSWSWTANDITMSRIYTKTFETVCAAPLSPLCFTLAKICSGALRGFYSALLIVLLSFCFALAPRVDWFFMVIVLGNCVIFAAAGFIAGLLIESHADMAKITNFIMTPMSFLCGTFFPLERLPGLGKTIVSLLPLSQVTIALRGGPAPFPISAPILLGAYLAILIPLAVLCCAREDG